LRIIIAGSRGVDDHSVVGKAIKESGLEVTEVVSGCARGVDRLGEEWAEENDVPLRRFPADWERHGSAAGFIRNAEMARHADALVAIWDGSSRGTAHMIKLARRKGLIVKVFSPKGEPRQ